MAFSQRHFVVTSPLADGYALWALSLAVAGHSGFIVFVIIKAASLGQLLSAELPAKSPQAKTKDDAAQ